MAGSKGSRVHRPRFSLYLPISVVWLQTMHWIYWLFPYLMSVWFFTSPFHPGPFLCTYLVQHCVPWRTFWAGYLIHESQSLGLRSIQWHWRLAMFWKQDLGRGFRGLLIPEIVWEMAYWALGVPVRIFPHVLKDAPTSELGRNCCCGRSHPGNMMWMGKHDLSQRARPWRWAQGVIGAHNGDWSCFQMPLPSSPTPSMTQKAWSFNAIP